MVMFIIRVVKNPVAAKKIINAVIFCIIENIFFLAGTSFFAEVFVLRYIFLQDNFVETVYPG